MKRVVALLASHNRRDRTVACLAALLAQDVPDVTVEAVLVDDGSSDGTGDAARAVSERVTVLRGDGSLYWARAMALAERHAARREPDYLLWLNDDVVLYPQALRTLLAHGDPPADGRIVVGMLVDPDTGMPTYGGVERVDWHPMRYRLVVPANDVVVHIPTFNGNVVLVPKPVFSRVGGIDGGFVHAHADFDYGLRAQAHGFQSVVAGTAVGTCPRGAAVPWVDASISLVTRYRLMLGRKGIPLGSNARYLRRHGGRLWPIYLSATYVKLALDHYRGRFRDRSRFIGGWG